MKKAETPEEKETENVAQETKISRLWCLNNVTVENNLRISRREKRLKNMFQVREDLSPTVLPITQRRKWIGLYLLKQLKASVT